MVASNWIPSDQKRNAGIIGTLFDWLNRTGLAISTRATEYFRLKSQSVSYVPSTN